MLDFGHGLGWIWPTVQYTVVEVLTAAAITAAIIAPLGKAIKRLWRRINAVIDSLDPDVPTGVTEQLRRIEDDLGSRPR